MTYRIEGLDPASFKPLFALSDAELQRHGAVRMRVDEQPGFPCRVGLRDAAVGETVLLVNHISHDVANPYRASHAIFVAAGSTAARFDDAVPEVMDRRVLSLRAFDAEHMMSGAALAQPGEADAVIRRLLDSSETAYIQAHHAIRGCFAARIERHDD